MANVIQAAQWMREGKSVTRETWPTLLSLKESPDDGNKPIVYGNGAQAAMFTTDLLAEDWRIA